MTRCSGPRCATPYSRPVAQGWTDAVRVLHPDERIYTFWKYFRNAFARDAGLRIDHLLLSPSKGEAGIMCPGTEFAPDSPQEEAGFEPSVPP